jgi:hypothetical protein
MSDRFGSRTEGKESGNNISLKMHEVMEKHFALKRKQIAHLRCDLFF